MHMINTNLRKGFMSASGVMVSGYSSIVEAERAYVLRDHRRLHDLARTLSTFPISSVGAYYRGISLLQGGETDRSFTVLTNVAQTGPQAYRARSYLALGAIAIRRESLVEALDRYGAAEKLAEGCDLRAYTQARKMSATIEGVNGDHRRALKHLLDIGPLVETAGRDYPLLNIDYLNSLALEFQANGQTAEATDAARAVSQWPLIGQYPEFQDTCRGLSKLIAHRSRITLHQEGFCDTNTLQMSAANPQQVEVVLPGKLLPFQRPVRGSEEGYAVRITFGGDPTALYDGRINEKQMRRLLRLVESF